MTSKVEKPSLPSLEPWACRRRSGNSFTVTHESLKKSTHISSITSILERTSNRSVRSESGRVRSGQVRSGSSRTSVVDQNCLALSVYEC